MQMQKAREAVPMSVRVFFCVFALIYAVCLSSCGDTPAETGQTATATATETESATEPAAERAVMPTPCDLRVGIGSVLPAAGDFFENLPDGASAEFLTDLSVLDRMGEHTLRVRVTLANGESDTFDVTLTLVTDTVSPVIYGVADKSVTVGDGVAYRKGVTVTDDCFGTPTLTVDSSAVRTDAVGDYPVVYTATDASGNTVTVTAYVHVYAAVFDEALLWDCVDRWIENNIRAGDSVEEKCRAVYGYVHDTVGYTGTSDKSDWKREAYRAITEETGDCFTYFALSKAILTRLGIQNMDVERRIDVAQSVGERHYWSLVNIGTESESRWYHFDACRLSQYAGYAHSGCLLTDKQVDAYSKLRTNGDGVGGYFYVYDRTKYPATATEIITATPELEPYD